MAKLTCFCSGMVVDQTIKESFRFRNIDELKERRAMMGGAPERETQDIDEKAKDTSGSDEIEKA